MSYVAPSVTEKRFNCPFCNAFSDQHWSDSVYTNAMGAKTASGFMMSRCVSCGRIAIWWDKHMVFPDVITAPLPNPDMPNEIKEDFEEARIISPKSSRGASALLRLCVEKLCIHLGEESGDLNTKIGNLVARGLRPEIQQSLDAVRVIGNETVHPGTLDVRDDPNIAKALFELVNLIIQTMITDPKKAQEIFDKLPQEKKDGINQRDNTV